MKRKINRRNFLKNTAAGSAGMIMGTSLFSSSDLLSATGQAKGNNIGGISPVALIEDVMLLILRSGKTSGVIEYAITSDLHTRPAAPGNKGRLASLLPVNDKALLELLQTLKENRENNNYTEKISIAFGWICYNSCHKFLHPVYEKHSTNEEHREIQLYQDATIVRDIMGGTPENQNDLASLFNEIMPRAITRVHTLIPAKDGAEWVNRMSTWRELNKNYLNQLAKIILDPEPGKMEKYVNSVNFYDENDDLIKYCRDLQRTINVKPGSIEIVLNENVERSLYSMSIGEAYKNILTTVDYFDGSIPISELEDKLFTD